jgi:two-component system chemotaxis response regulator CheB
MTPSGGSPTRVVVVEDSVVQRAHLVRVLEADRDIAVVGQAVGASDAVALVSRVHPDVITLDLEIPGGGGREAIEGIMGRSPTPILVISKLVASDRSPAAVEALFAGALDAMPKPDRWTPGDEAGIRDRVRALKGATVVRPPRPRPTGPAGRAGSGRTGRGGLVAIAASTGGPPALGRIFSSLGGLAAPILVVQHIHPDFVESLVVQLARVAPFEVRVASDGDRLQDGVAYVGPGDLHLRVSATRQIALSPDPETMHRPSGDELLRSVAEHAGPLAIGVILTGMGSDGAAGLAEVRRRGGHTIAQDEATSAVFGMPRAARDAGAVMEVLPLEGISRGILAAARRVPR